METKLSSNLFKYRAKSYQLQCNNSQKLGIGRCTETTIQNQNLWKKWNRYKHKLLMHIPTTDFYTTSTSYKFIWKITTNLLLKNYFFPIAFFPIYFCSTVGSLIVPSFCW